MKISVIICTRNRAQLLAQALESLETQTLSEDEFEVVVVDNGSTDSTHAVATEHAVRYVYEKTTGLSQARNTGWKHAHGEYIAFLDDDAVAGTKWLQKILESFQMTTDTHVCVGGKIVLKLQSNLPTWLDPYLYFCLGALDCSATPTSLNDTVFMLHGCNFAVKKSTLMKFNGFDTTLGRHGKQLLSGEEILLQQQIKDIGGTLYYHPDAEVIHHTEKGRLTRGWFVTRMYFEGVSTARINRRLHRKNGLRKELRLLSYELGETSSLFTRFCIIARSCGRLTEWVW